MTWKKPVPCIIGDIGTTTGRASRAQLAHRVGQLGEVLRHRDVLHAEDRVEDAQQAVAVPDHALRAPGGAAGEQDDPGAARHPGIGLGSGRAGGRGRVVDSRLPHVAADLQQQLQPAVSRHGAGGVGQALVHDQRRRCGVVERVAQLRLPVAVVDVDRHGAEVERGQHRLEVLRAVVQAHRDDVARPDPAAGERAGDPGRALVQLRVGQLHVADRHRELVRGHVGRHPQRGGDAGQSGPAHARGGRS
nr:hypothetical protein [Pseudonocardia thermophila]